MSKMNLGLESLTSQSVEFNEDMIIDMQLVEENICEDLKEIRTLMTACSSFESVVSCASKHGSYSGFEELIADKAALDKLLGIDICIASSEELATIVSSEVFRDSVNKFLSKVNALLGRLGDKISNFVKTTLPFKEKYLKEMTEFKQFLNGKDIDEEKFAEQKVASALSKQRYNEFVTSHKKLLDILMKVASDSSEGNINSFLEAADRVPDTMRTSMGTFFKQPWKSWFETDKVKNLGYKSSDVLDVVDKAIESIKNMVELNTVFSKMSDQFNRLETEISQDRATGKVDEAIAKRENVARLQEFFFQMWEAAMVYDSMIRREMYFATYLARAAKKCMK